MTAAGTGGGRSLLRSFINFNRHLSMRFDSMLPAKWRIDGHSHFQKEFLPYYIRLEEGRTTSPDGLLVYDIGGGKRPYFSAEEKSIRNLRVVGLDINQDELARAPCGAYDDTICADITEYRGRADGDIIICQALLEHTSDTQAAFVAMASILKPGGIVCLFTPSRNAIFARINLIIPNNMTRRLLSLLLQKGDESGFPAYYDRCTLSHFENMSINSGLSVVQKRTYFCSSYFTIFFPLYVLWRCYQFIFYFLNKEASAETFSMVLRKED